MSQREDILKAEKLEPVPFPCEWGMLYLRRFTIAQASEWHKFAQSSTDENGVVYPDVFRCKLVQLTVVTKEDELVFKPEDVSVLCGKPASIIAQIFLASCELNCLTNQEVAKARANFLSQLRNALGSASQTDSAKPTSQPSVSG